MEYFGRAQKAVEETKIAAAREKIELKITEYTMKCIQEGEELTIDGLEEFLVGNEEITIEKESDTRQ